MPAKIAPNPDNEHPSHQGPPSDAWSPDQLISDGGGEPGVYRIEGWLASGGYSYVYLCSVSDPSYKDTVLVMKVNQTKAKVPHLFREARWQTAVPGRSGIVPCYWADHTTVNGVPYALYVMPYMREGNLVAKIDKGDYTYLDVVNWVYGVADTLEQIDAIHRDLKPENIMLYGGRSMVADFGLAVHVKEVDRQAWGEEITIAGTPHYMAPEQFVASLFKDLDVRCDIYSLAMVFYELWSRSLPFDAKLSWEAIKDLKVTGTLTLAPLGHASADAFVQKNLSKKRDKRSQTWVEFKAGLQALRAELMELG